MDDDPSHAPRACGWLSLRSPAAADVSLAGSKASGLARSAAAGLPTVPGWVLPVPAAASLTPDATASSARQAGDDPSALAWARELMSLAPGVSQWILRSSSPGEDLAGASAAGLLGTEIAPAVPEALAAALVAVAASGQAAAVRALLQAPQGVPVAVLAQPLMQFTAWWTLEVRPADGVVLLDGWRTDAGASRPLVAQLPWPAAAPLDREEAARPDRAASRTAAGIPTAALALARAVVEAWGPGNWQLEVGEREGSALLLQVRPAPAVWAPLPEREIEPTTATTGTVEAKRGDVPRFPLHTEDQQWEWRWDLEHCPTPLCPLLAGWFARWLEQLPASHPSRLIQGRWHDRQGASASAVAPCEPRDPWPAPPDMLAAAAHWERHGAPALQISLDELAGSALELTRWPERWPAFMAQWLGFQRDYFDAPQWGAARAWARDVVLALGRRQPPVAPPPLPETEADRRERDLRRLADALRAALADETAVASSHHLELTVAQRMSPGLAAVADAIALYRHRYAHEAVAPWDGRGACLEEDASPLYRELARRLTAPLARDGHRGGAAAHAAPRTDHREAALARFEQQLAATIADPVERTQVRDAALLAVRILGWAEDDDVLLARSYALFRRAARTVARVAVATPLAEREVFEVLPADLEAQLRTGDAGSWRAAVRRGRALAALWDAHAPGRPAPADGPATSGLPGEQRRGLAAAPGRAVGPLRRVAYAQQHGGPMPGDVLVVPTLLPHDAVVLGRVAAVIVESGSPLGHAAVLAREHGVPAVVALPGALRWLASAQRVLVDGDQGSVTILAASAEHGAPTA